MDVRRLRDPFTALGVALHFLGQRAPFSTFKAADLVSTVDGQIRREHYLMALDGQKVAGYIGWALFDNETADRLTATGEQPSNDLAAKFAKGGDAVWLLTVAATRTDALRKLLAAGRSLYPGKRILGVRHGAAKDHLVRSMTINPLAESRRSTFATLSGTDDSGTNRTPDDGDTTDA
ncbi:hypothetical protein [Ensifer soli]|uniref:hypothetical protein n=1 Tax=Ciceribacter sp. sgz301302 TaxID=3342379 RepID=UPI0035B9E4ED